jgi:hypothetical protein
LAPVTRAYHSTGYVASLLKDERWPALGHAIGDALDIGPVHVAECQYVMEVLGDLPLSVAYERLAGMVRMLGEDVQAMALRNAFAIDMLAPETLTRRRERIAGIHGLSIDTIELYERNMIDELALRLAHGELPVGS